MTANPPDEDATFYEAIVVGSGFGGAVAACRLAQAGVRVLILERGRRYGRRDFPALPESKSLLPDFRRWAWKPDQGLWDVMDLQDVVSVQAAGFGGGSLLYANVHMRPPAEVLSKWPAPYNQPEQFERFYDLVAYMLQVAPVDSRREFYERIPKADQFRKATAHLGRAAATFHPPLAIAYEDRINIHGVTQKGCTACGACSTGCAEGAKNTLDQTYLATAERRGAHAKTECEVIDIERDGRTWIVRCIEHLTGSLHAFRAKFLFLCAGSVHSTRLLARAQQRLENPLNELVRLPIGQGYSPGAGALAVAFDTQHRQHPSVGPAITTTVVHWDSKRSFHLVQDGGYPKQLARLSGVFRAPAWVGRNRLSIKGKAKVAASSEPMVVLSRDPDGLALPSLADDILVALCRGDFQKVVSDRQRHYFRAFQDELKNALLLPEIVEKTIANTLADRFAQCWLTRRCQQDRPPLKWLIKLLTKVAGFMMGGFQLLAINALRAIISFGGLSPRQWASRVLAYDDEGAEHRLMMLAMGSDSAKGELLFERDSGRFIAELDLFDRAAGYGREELLMTDIARALGGELRTNPAWALLGKPITVHNQGGARMGVPPENDGPNIAGKAYGVTDIDGQVHGCDGLYVLDGSILPTSVGVNPSATIAAVAERCILAFIRRYKNPAWPESDNKAEPEEVSANDPKVNPKDAGAAEYSRHWRGAVRWRAEADRLGWVLTPPGPPNPREVAFRSERLGVAFDEVLEGCYSATEIDPDRQDAEYRKWEIAGRPANPIKLELRVACKDLVAFMADPDHKMAIDGVARLRLPLTATTATYRVTGEARLFVAPRAKRRYFSPEPQVPPTANRPAVPADPEPRRIARAPEGPDPAPTRFMEYELRIESQPEWYFFGYKRISDEPRFDAWRDTSSLFFTLARQPPRAGVSNPIAAAGAVHVDMMNFIYQQIPSLRVTGTTDPARVSWAMATFSTFFMGSLQRVYVPEVRSMLDALFGPPGTDGPHANEPTNLKVRLKP